MEELRQKHHDEILNDRFLAPNQTTNLFKTRASFFPGDLSPSQFPVFTIYVQKTCLKSASKCSAAWAFERVMDHEITATEVGKSQQTDRAACMETCLMEDKCRSAQVSLDKIDNCNWLQKVLIKKGLHLKTGLE